MVFILHIISRSPRRVLLGNGVHFILLTVLGQFISAESDGTDRFLVTRAESAFQTPLNILIVTKSDFTKHQI